MELTEIQSEISSRIARIGKKFGLDRNWAKRLWQRFSVPLPHQKFLEIGENGYHYCKYGRNEQQIRQTTKDIDELLYWIFYDLCYSKARSVDLEIDFVSREQIQIAIYKKMEEFMGELSEDWLARMELEHIEIFQGKRDDIIGLLG